MAITKNDFEKISSNIESRISELLTRYPNNYGELFQSNYPMVFLFGFLLLMLLCLLFDYDYDTLTVFFAVGFFGSLISISLMASRMQYFNPLELNHEAIIKEIDALENQADGFEDVRKYCAVNREAVVKAAEYKLSIDRRFRTLKRVAFALLPLVVFPLVVFFSDIKDDVNSFYKFVEVSDAPSFRIPIDGTSDSADIKMIAYKKDSFVFYACIDSIEISGATPSDCYEASIIDADGLKIPFFNSFPIASESEKEAIPNGLKYRNISINNIVPVADDYENLSLNFTRGLKAFQERELRLRIRKVN